MRLWIDTDIGTNPDDAITLLVAAVHPAVELVGVSTVGEDPERGAEAARELLAKTHPDVPVVAGPPAEFAADALLAIGPLTNVAAARNRLPPALTIMGGALAPVRHRGAIRRAEYNLAADPRSAAAVLARPGATLVPLDVTVATRLTAEQQAALLEAAPVLRPLVDRWLDLLATKGVPPDDRAVHLHDPAALLVAAGDPAAGPRTEPMRLSVEIDGRVTTGAPVGPVHQVVVALDAPGVVARVLELLG